MDIVVNGKSYKSMRECLLEYGMDSSHFTLWWDRNKSKYDSRIDGLQAYINMVVERRAGTFEFNGKRYSSVCECLKEYDVGHTFYDWRKKNKDDYDNDADALIAYMQIMKKRPIEEFTFRGRTYSCTTACLRELGLDDGFFNWYKKYTNDYSSKELALEAYLEIKNINDCLGKHFEVRYVKERGLTCVCKKCGHYFSDRAIAVKHIDLCYDTEDLKLIQRDGKYSIEVFGKRYDTFRSCCSDLHLECRYVIKFADKNNVTSAKAIEMFVNRNEVKLEYNGVKYKSVRSCCDALGISSKGLNCYKRSHNFDSLQDAIIDYMDNRRDGIDCNGKHYDSKKVCCDAYGLNYNDVRRVEARLKYLDFETIINGIIDGKYELRTGKNTAKSFEYMGVMYSSKRDCCKACDLDDKYVHWVASRYDISFSAALYKCLHIDYEFPSETDEIEYRGRKYKSKNDLFLKFSVDSGAVYGLMHRSGCSFTDAVDYFMLHKKFILPSMKSFVAITDLECKCRKCKKTLILSRDLAFEHECIPINVNTNSKKTFTVLGKEYSTVAECLRDNGVTDSFRKWYKLHKDEYSSKEDALGSYINLYKSRPSTQVEYKGVVYETLSACLKANNVSVSFYKWYGNHKDEYNTIENAIDDYAKRNNSVEYNGKVYSSLASCCRDLGIKIAGLRSYKQIRGIDAIEDAINGYLDELNNEESIINKRGNGITVKGKWYKSLNACLSEFNLSDCTVRTYMKRNGIARLEYAIEMYLDGLSTGEIEQQKRDVTIDGQVYSSYCSCCKELGIDYSTVLKFKKDNNIDFLEEAISLYISTRKTKAFTYEGVEYLSLSSCCDALGISMNGLYGFKNRHSFDSYSDLISAYIESIEGRSFEYKGVLYLTKIECCESLGTTYDTVIAVARHYKIDFEEALSGIIDGKYVEFLNYTGLGKYFKLVDYDSCSSTNLFMCSCRKCHKEFVFTRDLAFKHVDECKGLV